ncbi:MAG TPA: winged helix DNA-binding domain-containing protein, partial [Cyanobacteria bacterium UBA8530]|nr:winged helix DNA-binding domain-containing protein [Cyanobacteria bacterium UBA8530]
NSAPRQRSLELDEATFQQSKRLFFEALQGDKQLTRREMFALLNQANISTAGQRGYYLLWRNAQEGSICFGPMRDKQQTFVLLDEWAPNAKRMERDQALAELANRYFSSRGPATLQDFVWWSGLKVADARAGLEAIASQLRSKKIDDQTYWMPPDRESLPSISPQAHLLPGFDEYLLAYKDRSAMLETQHSQIISPGGGMFRSTIVLNGRVFGAWRRVIKKGGVSIALQPFGTPDEAENRALFKAASDYGEFLGMPVSLS